MTEMLTEYKIMADIVEATVTSAALIVGGFWTYLKFIRHRIGYPQGHIDISLQETPLSDGNRIIHARVRIRNIGAVILVCDYAELRLRSILPFPEEIRQAVDSGYDIVRDGENRVEWPMIAGREWNESNLLEVEPNEEQTLHCDFVIDDTHEVIELYCYARNTAKKQMGWSTTHVHRLKVEALENE